MTTTERTAVIILLGLMIGLSKPSAADDNLTYSGQSGLSLTDSGVMVVTGGGPFDRSEVFEYLRGPDGSIVLTNTITAANGAYRVAARFMLNQDWTSQSAVGRGLYNGKPVDSIMIRNGNRVDITVTGPEIALSPRAVCEPDCFINMSPSATAMFVMTRHYDFAKGGEQEFRWAGQDLDRERTLSGGKARLTFQGERTLKRLSGESLLIRHFTFVEALPTPEGGTFLLNFDMWTDDQHRPMGFRVRTPNAARPGVTGFRQGFEDVQQQLTPQN